MFLKLCSGKKVLEISNKVLFFFKKVIYISRNPKDVCVSYFHHMTDVISHMYEYQGTFDQFVELFMHGKLEFGSYFNHLKSAWKLRTHPNMKFIWYEDMKNDSIKKITEITEFPDRWI